MNRFGYSPLDRGIIVCNDLMFETEEDLLRRLLQESHSWSGTSQFTAVALKLGSVPSVVTDFAILILPLPAVWGLNMGLTQMISINGILLLGSLYVNLNESFFKLIFESTYIISVVRLATLIKNNNNTVDVTCKLILRSPF